LIRVRKKEEEKTGDCPAQKGGYRGKGGPKDWRRTRQNEGWGAQERKKKKRKNANPAHMGAQEKTRCRGNR